MCGNEALAEAAIRAGLDAYFGYPITPQNEITAYLAKRMPEEGRVFVQSESELAAINMVFGAAATGKRTMTSSSSPGVSLMQEGLSYLAGAELPSVVVNVMRGGPGLGNIAPAQADYFQSTRGGGHGDYRTIVLAPSTVQEIVDSTGLAFDLADMYRMTVLILIDGILGQMMEPIVMKDAPPRKDLPAKDWALTGARGRNQNIVRSLWLGEGVLEQLNEHLKQKYAEITEKETRCYCHQIEDAEIILVSYGVCARVVRSAVDKARQNGIKAGWIRPFTLWPFPSKTIAEAAKPDVPFLVVEMSMGQMLEDVQLSLMGKAPTCLLGRAGGGVPTVEQVLKKIEQTLDKTNNSTLKT